MNNLKNLLKWEFILLYRYKLIHITFLSILLYIVSMKITPADIMPEKDMLPLLLFFDPAIIGIMFVGAIVLFEKAENTLPSLVVTPMKVWEYLASKIISLTVLATISAVLFVIFATWSLNFNYFFLFVGIILTSVFLVLVGFLMVARLNTINEYLLMMMLAFIGLTLPPLLHLNGLYENVIFYLWPTQASFILVNGVFKGIELWEAVYGIVYLSVWIVICFIIAKKAFYKHIVQKG